jgi:hypothetical protein
MNIVLYTKDFEPITVLDLPMWLLETLEKRGSIRIAVLEPTISENSDIVEKPEVSIVTVYLEKLPWVDGTKKSILVTDNEELALSLNPDWLPGQRYIIQSYETAIQQLKEALIDALRK